MDKIYTMKLHDVLNSEGDLDYQIVKVHGGWIYRFTKLNQVIMPNGEWSENYLCDSVFVPHDKEKNHKTPCSLNENWINLHRIKEIEKLKKAIISALDAATIGEAENILNGAV